MAQLHLSDEILMAFADGELDEPVATTVEQAMASDPAIAKRVAGFLRSRRLVRLAFPADTVPDVPPELRAAVQAQIDRFERRVDAEATPEFRVIPTVSSTGRWPLGTALAASVAALAIATAGYLVGRQSLPPSQNAAGLMANLDPQVSSVLSGSRSGQEQDLPFGRMRVISTFRMANGSLCREFKLQAPSGTSDAVACRNGGWTLTFAVASAPTNGAYVPSGGEGLVENYLQATGAGEPLLDAAEIKALSEAGR